VDARDAFRETARATMHPWLHAVLLPETVLGSFLVLFIGGVSFYLVTSGSSYLYYFRLRKDRYFPNDTPDPAQMKKERRWAIYSLLGNAVITAPIHHLIVTGRSRVYLDVADHGVGWLVVSALLFLVITETLVYWAHRALHHPWLYKRVHLYHHQFRVTTPWTSVAFHPLDSFAQAAPHHLCAFLFPVHVGVYAGFVLGVTLWSVIIHERVTFVRNGLVNYTMHHTYHHKYNKQNYGQFLTIWDRLMGTHQDPAGLVEDGYDAAPAPAAAEARGA
jgi:Delta7-sterol 5-desaturase